MVALFDSVFVKLNKNINKEWDGNAVQVGGPLGTRIRAVFGYVSLFGINLGLATIAILYSIFVLKDSIEMVEPGRREEIEMEKAKADIKCDQCKLMNGP